MAWIRRDRLEEPHDANGRPLQFRIQTAMFANNDMVALQAAVNLALENLRQTHQYVVLLENTWIIGPTSIMRVMLTYAYYVPN